MREIKQITMGCYKAYYQIPEHLKEKEVDIARALKSTKQSMRYKAVKCLVAAGATHVTVRGNPLCKPNSFTEGFYIFTGYAK